MTVRWLLLFILAGCPAANPSRQLPVQEPFPTRPPRPILDVPPDATLAPPVAPLPAPTPCGGVGEACTGTCVDTARGDLCFPACQTDAACRPKHRAFCDPQAPARM